MYLYDSVLTAVWRHVGKFAPELVLAPALGQHRDKAVLVHYRPWRSTSHARPTQQERGYKREQTCGRGGCRCSAAEAHHAAAVHILLLQLLVGRIVAVTHFAVAVAAHVLRLRGLHNNLPTMRYSVKNRTREAWRGAGADSCCSAHLVCMRVLQRLRDVPPAAAGVQPHQLLRHRCTGTSE